MENNNNQVFKRNEDANHPFGVQIYPTQKQNAFEDMLGYLEEFSSLFEKSGSYDEFMVAYEDEDEEALDKIDPKTKENVLRFKTVLDYLVKQDMISVKNDNKENGGWEILDDVENFDPRKMKQMLLRKHPDEDPYVWMMDDDGDVTMSDGPADEDELATVFSGGKLQKPEEPTGFLGLRKLFNSIKTALGGEPMDAYKKYNKQMQDYEREKYYTLKDNGFNVEKPAHVTEWEEREAKIQAGREMATAAKIKAAEAETNKINHEVEQVMSDRSNTNAISAFTDGLQEIMQENTNLAWGVRHFIRDCCEQKRAVLSTETPTMLGTLIDEFENDLTEDEKKNIEDDIPTATAAKEKLKEKLEKIINNDPATMEKYDRVIGDMDKKVADIQKMTQARETGIEITGQKTIKERHQKEIEKILANGQKKETDATVFTK